MPDRPGRPDAPDGEFASPAPREALEYFRFRGLKVGFDHRDVRPGERALAFTVAKAMDFDLLKEIRAALDRALGEGMPFGRFEQALTPLLKHRGWWGEREMTDPLTGKRVVAQLGSPRRLRAIYRANFRAAHGAGVWIRAQRTKDADPYFLYELGPVGEACGPHRRWAGTLLPIDHPWWDDHFPPNGSDCGCRVRTVGEREARRRGGPTEAPLRREVARWNERALRFDRVEEGLDPAWATNPGKLWAAGPMGPLGKDFGPADEAYARAAIESVLESPILSVFQASPRGDIPVGVLEEVLRGWIGTEIPVVSFPERIMHKQKGLHRDPNRHGHRDLTATDYRRLPALLEAPDTVFRPRPPQDRPPEAFGRRLCLMGVVAGKRYFAVVERDSRTQRVELISFFRRDMTPRAIGALLRSAREVLRSDSS